MPVRPLRSALYMPGSKPRALEKARSLPTDAIIFDLEDAVLPTEKPNARRGVVSALTQGGYAGRMCIVRINALDTPWGQDDVQAVAALRPDAILVPKVDAPGDIDAVRQHTDLPVWAMIETAKGVLAAPDIAKTAGIGGFVMGTNDLAKELGARSRAAMSHALQHCLLAARSGAIPCLDGVYNAFRDDDGLRRECEEGRDLGMDGKTVIHPAQLAITNEVFAPTPQEIELAQRQIIAFDDATARGDGVAVLDGRIVENLHIETARAILAKAAAIKAMETA